VNFAERRQRFRAVLQGAQCIHPASVFDPMSARIAEDIGFEAGIFAGSVASMTVLGAPDLLVLTLTELAEQVRRICRASALPLLVDADHGFGNALSVMRTVQELEAAGAAALSIEDTALPQGFGEAGPRLVTLEEGVGKMRAALAARSDPGLVIFGRTSALALSSPADAIARLQAYEATGVDALFVVGATTQAQLAAVRAATRLPLLCVADGELTERAQLAALGVRIALQGHQPIVAAMQAVHETLSALRAGTPPAALARLPGKEQVARALRAEDYARAAREFLQPAAGPGACG
jgi:carboxyvinyl-carboxyphosphonate phosphorylmutase